MDEELTAHPLPSDFDPSVLAERLGALPQAPLEMPHQMLEAPSRRRLATLVERLTHLGASLIGAAPWPGRLEH